MPIFNDCTGFHIHDGNFHQVSGDANFYQVSGDVHLQTQQLMIGDHPAHPDVAREALAGPSGSIPSAAASQLQDGWTEGFRREPPGAARSLRRTMTAPYDASSRPRMRGSSDFEGYPGPAPSTSSALIPSSGFSSPYSQGESRHEWNRPSIPPSMPLPPINPSSNSRSQSHYPLDYQYFYPGPLPGPRPDYDRQEGGSQLPGVEASPNRPDYRPSDLAPRFDRVQPGAEPSIHGGTFITAQNVNNDYRHGETGINILHRGVALEALHDSADSFPQPRCHPETRKQMLDDLWGFATDAEHRDRVLWLHGPAGAGKSAIMWSLCERLQDVGRLGAAFFFKRGHPTRGNARALFSTIAYRLALRIPWLKGPISQAVESDPSLVSSTPRIQFQQLVLGPCRARTDQAPAIIIIDGLDECDGRQMQQEILRILSSHQHHNSVRILVASRPEAHISEITSNAAAYQAFNVEQSFKDVRRYLVDEFARIRQAHARTMRNVPTPWPSHEELETLVDKSSGHFIYASTVIKFVDDPNFRPTKRLGIIVGNLTDSEYDTPFSTLDELYTQILSTAPKNTQLVNILCAIVYFPGHFSPCDIDRLLELEAGDTDLALRSLHSLVKLEWRQVRWHHASFEDFLCDASRAGKFYVGELASRMDLARSVLNALSSLDLAHDAAWCVLLDAHVSSVHFGTVHRSVGWDWIRYVVESVPPSAALLPLIRSINPVFFGAGLGSEEEDKIIGWFQVCL
ncbi:hypothetical protein B0H17DRAFT_1005562 [Mycena rosella]|uniref:Nephrocystin 3-like N-terminal domain-containing protein n=1 Tax=Mycena rosella TaxID=1033263 RepID=A0AAD7GLE1_MYCRO|nr:hypothetical protein B0H17DRAFT_1005562 [Mycena rosella]